MNDKPAIDTPDPDEAVADAHHPMCVLRHGGVYIRCETCDWTSVDMYNPTLPELHTIWDRHLRSVAIIEAAVGVETVDADDTTHPSESAQQHETG